MVLKKTEKVKPFKKPEPGKCLKYRCEDVDPGLN